MSNCPKCGTEVDHPLKIWKIKQTPVALFECPNCKTKWRSKFIETEAISPITPAVIQATIPEPTSISPSEGELPITNSFRELINYINNLGEHINQIYDLLEKIDIDISKVREEQVALSDENKKELEIIKKTTITKSEFNDLLKKLNEPFEKFTPPKTTTEQPGRTRT